MRFLVIFLLCTTAFLSGCIDKGLPISQDISHNMADNAIKTDMVIGDLGGVPVEMPKDSVRLVEYDGDPDWGESFEGEILERTYQSKINSFGFDVRYTDGAIYDGIVGEFADEYEQQKNLPDSPWVSVGINSGNRYHRLGGIHRIGDGTINPKYKVTANHHYAKLPDLQYGLEVYAPPGIDPKTNTPWRENRYAEDVFIQRDQNRTITTYIKCSNRDVVRPPCTHYFDLEPQMGLDVYVSYPRHVLKDWQQIQEVVTKAILSFRK